MLETISSKNLSCQEVDQ